MVGTTKKSAETKLCMWFWVIGYVFPAVGWGAMGLFPAWLIATSTLAGLLEIVVASVIGAWLYKE
jgi:hypothetical protein